MRFKNENTTLPPRIAGPLTFTAIAYSTISFNNSAPQLQYKINNGSWIDYDTASVQIYLNAGDKIKWKRKVSTVRTTSLGQFHMTGQLSVSGNIMSLLDGDNYYNMTSLAGWGSTDGIFFELFNGCTALMSAGNLVLPATTIETKCYRGMFKNCSNLSSAPNLPATYIKSISYSDMFMHCTSLVNPPVINATVLATSCCWNMFYGCSSLQTAPVLNATNLVKGCYYGMFNRCTNLNYIKCLAESGFGTDSCLTNWTARVNAIGTFVKKAGVTDWTAGVNGIPVNWTITEE